MYTIGKSSVGLVREKNEDAYGIHQSDEYVGIIVADGMGGHNHGDVASNMAVKLFEIYFNQIKDKGRMTRDEVVDDLATFVKGANLTIYTKAKDNHEYRGMGTTIVCGLITEEYIALASVGDSRIYSWDEENLYLLTEDQTFVNALIKSGDISEEEALSHPKKNVLLQAVGTTKHVEVSTLLLNYDRVPTLLFCSDGLTGMLSDAEIHEILRQDSLNSSDKLELLIKRVYDHGARDNVTAVLWGKEDK
ncbi:MAG: Stp1/IreP family PP2C-type Ser/Thr phosphatase [Culicoidibacterales bacterium]